MGVRCHGYRDAVIVVGILFGVSCVLIFHQNELDQTEIGMRKFRTIRHKVLAAKIRKTLKQENGPFLGSGRVSPKLMAMKNIHQAKIAFHSEMTNISYRCKKMERFGNPTGGGGYEVCLDPPYEPHTNNCLVYSFGIGRDMSFDDAIHEKYGCEVHSFDHTIGKDDHMHKAPNMYFHKLGLWGSDKMQGKLKLMSIRSIISLLKHRGRVIDVLKADVEGAEWPFLVNFVQSGAFKQVKQLVMEPHTPRRISRTTHSTMSLVDYAEIYNSFVTLNEIGFKRFLFHSRNNCCRAFTVLVPPSISGNKPVCCYEEFFVNINYKK